MLTVKNNIEKAKWRKSRKYTLKYYKIVNKDQQGSFFKLRVDATRKYKNFKNNKTIFPIITRLVVTFNKAIRINFIYRIQVYKTKNNNKY